jgi:hypothetical protein
MKRIIALAALVLAVAFQSCERDGDSGRTKLRDYAEQYATDIADIELYLKTHAYTVVENPGMPDDMDVTFTQVPEGDPTAIWNSPNLMYRMVSKDNIEYKLYFLKLRNGGGAAGDKLPPCNVDGVLAAYRGSYIFHYSDTDTPDELRTFEFESVQFPQSNMALESVIRGWSEVYPQFRPGDFTQVNGQPTVYTDFGAGVMFLPSGLGYYGQSAGSIPAYSPLIFSFKLYEITRYDQDGDGIPSWLEDIDGDGYMYALPPGTYNPDDTDGDLAPDYLDLDDDGDNVLTKVELRRPKQNPEDATEPWTFYSFDGAAVDDPNTWYDDTLGAPDCSGDHTSPNRLRKYLDPNCQ